MLNIAWPHSDTCCSHVVAMLDIRSWPCSGKYLSHAVAILHNISYSARFQLDCRCGGSIEDVLFNYGDVPKLRRVVVIKKQF